MIINNKRKTFYLVLASISFILLGTFQNCGKKMKSLNHNTSESSSSGSNSESSSPINITNRCDASGLVYGEIEGEESYFGKKIKLYNNTLVSIFSDGAQIFECEPSQQVYKWVLKLKIIGQFADLAIYDNRVALSTSYNQKVEVYKKESNQWNLETELTSPQADYFWGRSMVMLLQLEIKKEI